METLWKDFEIIGRNDDTLGYIIKVYVDKNNNKLLPEKILLCKIENDGTVTMYNNCNKLYSYKLSNYDPDQFIRLSYDNLVDCIKPYTFVGTKEHEIAKYTVDGITETEDYMELLYSTQVYKPERIILNYQLVKK